MTKAEHWDECNSPFAYTGIIDRGWPSDVKPPYAIKNPAIMMLIAKNAADFKAENCRLGRV